MARRLPELVSLPTTMPTEWRTPLQQILSSLVREVNWQALDITAIAASAAVGHDVVLADASATAVTVTLPDAERWRDREIRVKKIDTSANRVNLVGTNGQTIDGTATAAITQPNTCVDVVAARGNWYIV